MSFRTPAHVLRCLAERLHALRSENTGNITVLFALGLVPMGGFLGAAVDYSRANAAKAAIQASVDSIALTLAKSSVTIQNSELSIAAAALFNGLYFQRDTDAVEVSASYTADGAIAVAAKGTMKTILMNTFGLRYMTVNAYAVAGVVGAGKACVLSLNRNASGAITAKGSASIGLTGCGIYSNSTSGSAISISGSATISALAVGAVGGISGVSGVNSTRGIVTGISATPDPYAKVSVPYFSGCTAQNFTAHSTITIEPGVYCGGMQLNATAIVTLNPGLYFIDGGELSIKGGATLQGKGVTLVFTSSTMSNWATASIAGGANINLTPPATGPTAGLVMFGDRNAPLGTSFKLTGGASQYLGGAIYIPTGDLNFAGGMGTDSACSQIIADTITFVGNSDLAINCNDYGTKPFGPGGVRLFS